MDLEIHHFMVELKDIEISKLLSILENVGKHVEVSENIHVFMSDKLIVYVTLFSETMFLDILAKEKEQGLRIVKNIVDEAQMQKIMTHYVYRGF